MRHRLIKLIPLLAILATVAIGATVQRSATVVNINSGELSPLLQDRIDFPKQRSGAKILQNMLVRTQGPATRRPGTKYVATVKDSTDYVRLIPFEYSTTDTYIIELGDLYARFYRNGAQVLSGASAYEVVTPWDANDLFELQWAQDSQYMRIVHPDYQPYKLTRNSASHTDWSCTAIDFEKGPFLDENETTTNTITPSATTGSITLEYSGSSLFDADHVGALWQISHLVDANDLTGIFWGAAGSGDVNVPAGGTNYTDSNSLTIYIWEDQEYTVTTSGDWIGTLIIQRSYDNKATWDDVKSFTYRQNGNIIYTGTEDQDNAYYRLRIENQLVSAHMFHRDQGVCSFTLSADTFIRRGVVEITAVTDANTATATVEEELASTDATYRWAEGAWSDYRGWPRTVEHHEQRCVYGGTASYPQTVWASITASQDSDYDDFDEGLGDAADAWTYVLPGMNPIQWMASDDYLMIGTTAGIGRLGSPDKPIDATWTPTYRLQAKNGAAYIDAVDAVDSLLFVERGGQKVRQIEYTYASNRYIAPDVSLTAEHITGNGVVEIDFQNRPDPILWSVREDGVLLSLTYMPKQEVLAWARHVTGQTDPNDSTDHDDFESVAVIPGNASSLKANGDARYDDEVWVLVKRTVDSNTVRYVEQFQPLDWGSDDDYCWFVDCAGYGTAAGSGDLSIGTAQYPTLQALDSGDIPTAPSQPADTALAGETSISDAAGLAAITAGNHYVLTQDINMAGESWTPLTFASSSDTVIDGNDFTISNLSYSNSTLDAKAFIGAATGSGGIEIRNLTFSGCSTTGDEQIGILFGNVDATGAINIHDVNFTNCTVTTYGDEAGVFAGDFVSDANVYIYDVTATNCTVTSDASANAAVAMGVLFGTLQASVDTNEALYISNADVVGGSVSWTRDTGGNLGGWAAQISGGGSDANDRNVNLYGCDCSADVSVTAKAANDGDWAVIGLFCGYMDNALVSTCTASGTLTLTTNSSWVNQTDEIESVGGFAGDTNYGTRFVNCSASGTISAPDGGGTPELWKWGGFVGDLDSTASVLGCNSTVPITVATDTCYIHYVGGFAGYLAGRATVQKSYCSGDLTFTGTVGEPTGSERQTVSGFAGEVGTAYSSTTISDCYTWSSIVMSGSYPSTPSGFSYLYIGGFAYGPYNNGAILNFERCYAAQTNAAAGSGLTGQLPAGDYTYGFGGVSGTPTYTGNDLYYDTTTSSVSTSEYGDGHITAWMQTQSNYEAGGYDFNDVWYMPGAGSTNWSGLSYAEGLTQCVYADGRPIGTFTVSSSALELGASYSVVIAGLNYYSILETEPLVSDETIGRRAGIKSVSIDFYETMGAHVGADIVYSTDWEFSEDDFATAIDPFSGWKGPVGFLRGISRTPTVYIWEWDPVPMTIRAIQADLEVTLE